MISRKEISICIVDYALAGDFFLRLSKSDKNREYIFVTTLLSTFLKARGTNETYLVSKLGSCNENKVDNLPIERVREISLKILSIESSLKLASAINTSVLKIIKKYNGTKINILTWNGDNIIGAVMRQIKVNHSKIDLLFFELSNLKGKIFVDPLGVNAASSVFLIPEVIDKIASVDDDIHAEWLKKFYDDKKGIKALPQASKGKEIKLRHLIDFLHTKFFGFQTYASSSITNRFTKNKTISVVEDEIIPENYIFFPMQVSTDTQIVLNSDVDNVDVLNFLVEKENLPIVTKPHPAESDFSYIHEVKAKNKDKIIVSTKNTYDLIKKAQSVYTINSTVGMEAMLFDKNVIFMGRSVYSNMSRDDLKKYIHNYLVNIDFFDENLSITAQLIESVYSRRDNG